MAKSNDVTKALKSVADPKKAEILKRFFKTGKGEYGEGDVFIGVTVPKIRTVAKQYADIQLSEIEKLITSKIHEERLIALVILVEQYKLAKEDEKEKIYKFYLAHTRQINNWDLVDLSALHIAGAHLESKDTSILTKLARSKNLWERRIAIIATCFFIYKKNPRETFKIATVLLKDNEDLIHKAVGWMLREVGKRCGEDVEEEFLKERYKHMPRAMLRYAIERFPSEKRKAYLKGTVE